MLPVGDANVNRCSLMALLLLQLAGSEDCCMDPASDAPMPRALESNTHRHSRGVLLLTTNCTSGQLLFMNGNVLTYKTLGTAGHTVHDVQYMCMRAVYNACNNERQRYLGAAEVLCSAAQHSPVLCCRPL